MATTPVMNQYGGGVGTPGIGGSSFIPMGGNANNPTGTAGGSNTGTGVPMLNLGATAPGTTPTGTGTLSPATGTIAGLMSTQPSGTTLGTATGQNNQTVVGGQQTQRQDDRTLSELQNYYGEGIGSYIYGLMQTGGINMQLLNQVDTSQIAAMQPQINQGEANLNSTLGAQGVSANSSTSALANSQYLTNAVTQENAQISQNYLQQYDQGQQLLQSILGGVLKTNQEGTANQPNWMDYLNEGLQIAGAVAMV